jgi:hypothetical protein
VQQVTFTHTYIHTHTTYTRTHPPGLNIWRTPGIQFLTDSQTLCKCYFCNHLSDSSHKGHSLNPICLFLPPFGSNTYFQICRQVSHFPGNLPPVLLLGSCVQSYCWDWERPRVCEQEQEVRTNCTLFYLAIWITYKMAGFVSVACSEQTT